MSEYVLKDCGFYLGAYDLTGFTNQANVAAEADMLDKTNFGSGGWREFKSGLFMVSGDVAGFASVDGGATDLDAVAFANIGVPSVPLTIAPVDEAVGSPALMQRPVQATYMPPSGDVGQLAKFSAQFKGNGLFIGDGTILQSPDAAETATTDGTALQLGALASGETLYAVLHVLSVSAADTLDVIVESDSAEAFDQSPETQITFTQATAITSQWLSVAGPVTDDWWRVGITIGGTDPSFRFVVAAGIV